VVPPPSLIERNRRSMMNRPARILTALAFALSITSFTPAPAAPRAAGSMQTYLVLFKAQAVPSDAGAVVTAA
jgi:hypothetical protein